MRQTKLARSASMKGATGILFLYATITAGILILILSIFTTEKKSIWELIKKRYKASEEDKYKSELRKEVKVIERDFGKSISQGFSK